MSNSRRHLDHLVAAVLLRRVIALASEAPELTDTQLRARLLTLAGCAR